jgi:hypothetical protein
MNNSLLTRTIRILETIFIYYNFILLLLITLMNFPGFRFVLALFLPLIFIFASLPNLLIGIVLVVCVVANLFITKQFKGFRNYLIVLNVVALIAMYKYCLNVADQLDRIHFEGLPESSQLTPAANFNLIFGMYVALLFVYYFVYFLTKRSKTPQSNPPK